MAKLKNSISGLLAATLSMTVLLNACSTNDVEPIVPGEGDNLVEISDEALGQYLIYNCQRTDDERLPGGTAVERDGKYYLNPDIAATAENLYLVKNETQIKKLTAAGLTTAAQKITDMDVLVYFTSLKTLKLTSNDVRVLDITRCPDIETIEMNNNLVGVMDFSHATKLKRFRYGASDDATEAQKLSAADLRNCVSLEHLYLKNQNIGEGALTLPSSWTNLKEMDLSGNPGAPFPVPSALFAQLTLKNGVSDGGDKPGEPETSFAIPDAAFGEYLLYLCGQGTLPEGLVTENGGVYTLDIAKAATVTVLNVAKTAKMITTLTEAGLKTAATPISSAEGLQYFTALTEFTATSNNFTSPLPLTKLVHLEVLQVNTAGVSELDLGGNPRLRVLNCNGSSKYAKLKAIDLGANRELQTLNLKNNELATISLAGLLKLTEVDLSGNPGADFPIPAEIYNNLKTKKGVKPE